MDCPRNLSSTAPALRKNKQEISSVVENNNITN